MSRSRKTMFVLVTVILVLLSGCTLRSKLNVSGHAEYRPSWELPPQYADVHTAWKIDIDK